MIEAKQQLCFDPGKGDKDSTVPTLVDQELGKRVNSGPSTDEKSSPCNFSFKESAETTNFD